MTRMKLSYMITFGFDKNATDDSLAVMVLEAKEYERACA